MQISMRDFCRCFRYPFVTWLSLIHILRLVVNLFVFVRVPTLQDFFHLSNKLLLVRHIQDLSLIHI